MRANASLLLTGAAKCPLKTSSHKRLKRESVVYFLKNKSQTLKPYKSFKAKGKRKTGKKLRTYNKKEYVNADSRNVLDHHGIKHQTTCPYASEQKRGSTQVEKVQYMLKNAILGNEFWAKPISTAVHVVKRYPTRALEDTTPEEA